MCHCMNNLSTEKEEEEDERQTKSLALLNCQLVVVEKMRDMHIYSRRMRDTSECYKIHISHRHGRINKIERFALYSFVTKYIFIFFSGGFNTRYGILIHILPICMRTLLNMLYDSKCFWLSSFASKSKSLQFILHFDHLLLHACIIRGQCVSMQIHSFVNKIVQLTT